MSSFRTVLTLSLITALGAPALADDGAEPIPLNPPVAQTRSDMTPVDMISLPTLGNVDAGPTAGTAIITRRIVDWAENETISQFWRYDAASDTLTYLEGLDESDTVSLSPDGRHLAIDRPPEGYTADEVYIADADGSDLERLTRHPTSVRDISWSPDGEWIYFIATDDRTDEEEAHHDRYELIEPYFETTRFRHLWRVNVRTGGRQRMTQGDWSVKAYDVAANGTVLIRVAPANDLDAAYDSELWISAAAEPGGHFRRITSNDWMEGNARLSPDGSSVAYTARVGAGGLEYVQNNLVVLDVESGASRILTGGVNFEVDGHAWLPDGSGLIVAVQAGARSGLVRIDVETGAITQLSLEDRHLSDWSLADDGSVLAVFQTPDSNGDLWRVEARGDGGDARLTTIGAATVSAFNLPQQQLVHWSSTDGQEIEGFYFAPLDAAAGDGPPPLVVQAHGGPRSADEFGQWKWSRYVPVLTARGYGVLWVNYRGGVGYGDDFMQAMEGEYFAHAADDVLSGVDAMIERGLADPDRLIMSGWSAGGHMTNRIISMTTRFKAASSGAGAVDWAMHHLTSDTRQARRLLFGADAWGEGELDRVFFPQSLLRDLHRVETPTIIFAGADDERVHPAQSIMLYQALRNLGVETRLYLAPGEPHVFSDLDHRLFRINAELDWYARHIGGSYEWQPLPDEALEDD